MNIKFNKKIYIYMFSYMYQRHPEVLHIRRRAGTRRADYVPGGCYAFYPFLFGLMC